MSAEPEIQADDHQRAVQAFLNRPRRRIASPSPRQPDRSTHFNDADAIERQLQQDGHRTWGFVLYRTCYANDDEWAEVLRRVRFWIESDMDGFNGLDMFALHTLTVLEDPEHLDRASTAVVRRNFRQWRATAPQAEQQPLDEPGDRGRDAPPIGPGQSPRYRYAIQIDAASLHSILREAPAPPDHDVMHKGWVKLVDAAWEPTPSDRVVDPLEPVEGVVERDVGWMMVPYSSAWTEYYVRARDWNWWSSSYRRPPRVIGFVPQ